MMIFFGYKPPQKDDAQHVQIKKNCKYPLIESVIPKGLHVARVIMANLKKLLLFDNDLMKYKEF